MCTRVGQRLKLNREDRNYERTRLLSRLNKQLLIILKNAQMFSLDSLTKAKEGECNTGCCHQHFHPSPQVGMNLPAACITALPPTGVSVNTLCVASDTFQLRSITATTLLLRCCGQQQQPITDRVLGHVTNH